MSGEKRAGVLGSREYALEMLRQKFQPLFAVLDAARDAAILKLLMECTDEYESLYEGAQGRALTHFAPHLVRLPQQSTLLDALVCQGFGMSWGVYLSCDKPFGEVRRHFRQFLMVKAEKGEELYFRFYDPRVLRAFLPTCMPNEVDHLFGPIKCYLMEDENDEVLLEFKRGKRGLEKNIVELCGPEQLGL
jgi:hypothetical protein